MTKPKRSYRTTTNSKHLFHKHKNLVQDRVPHRPEQLWVGEITYIGYRSRNTYLALITDAYSKKIVGYDLSNSLDVNGSLRALKMASRSRKYPDKPWVNVNFRWSLLFLESRLDSSIPPWPAFQAIFVSVIPTICFCHPDHFVSVILNEVKDLKSGSISYFTTFNMTKKKSLPRTWRFYLRKQTAAIRSTGVLY